MKNYSKFLLTTLLAQSLVLAGCGGGSSSNDNNSSSSVSSSSVSSSSESSSSESSSSESSSSESSSSESSSSDSSSSESSSSESSSSSSAASETVFMLYEDGPSTLILDEDINNTLVPGNYADWGNGGSVVSEPGTEDGENTVWDIQLVPVANAFLSTSDMSDYEGVDAGVKFTDVAATGELRFDLKILAIDAETELQIKLDSGYPNVSYLSIDLPEEDVLTPVTVPFAELVALGEGQVVNYDNVTNLFVIEAVGGTAHVQLDNIRIVCPVEAGCDLDPVLAPVSDVITENFFVFENALDANWSNPGVQFYQAPNSAPHTSAVVDDGTGSNDVLQVTFGADGDWNSTMYVQTSTPKDLGAFAGGNLVFDIRVTAAGANSGAFLIKGEGGASVAPGQEHAITVNNDGAWHEMTVSVTDLKITNLSTVTVPISLWPNGNQNGVVFQLDNVRWELPVVE